MGTKLIVKINCEELRSENLETFKLCGWNSCSIFGFFKITPREEYDLWIPDLQSPLNIFSLSLKTNLCFAKLIKPHFNPNGNIYEDFIIKKKGLTV